LGVGITKNSFVSPVIAARRHFLDRILDFVGGW
jgi:hypothetical protein